MPADAALTRQIRDHLVEAPILPAQVDAAECLMACRLSGGGSSGGQVQSRIAMTARMKAPCPHIGSEVAGDLLMSRGCKTGDRPGHTYHLLNTPRYSLHDLLVHTYLLWLFESGLSHCGFDRDLSPLRILHWYKEQNKTKTGVLTSPAYVCIHGSMS